MRQASPLLIDKKEIAKKPIGNILNRYNSLMGAGRCGNIVQSAK
jgi:hypothetical protein